MTLQLELPKRVWDAISDLSILDNTNSAPATISRALAVYDCILRAMKDGAIPQLAWPDGRIQEVAIK